MATDVNADGHREILGLQVTSAEDCPGWLTFFRNLTARGLSGVALVSSDAHQGLVAAIGATVPGASWQRCRIALCRPPDYADVASESLVGNGFAGSTSASSEGLQQGEDLLWRLVVPGSSA